MPFTHPVPDWNAQGAEPPESLKTTGWAINQRPPADYFNWFFYNTAKAIIELQLEAINTDQKGVANGLATLGADGKLTASQLPATPLVTTSSNGLMSSADKTKLDGIEANANNYTHPSTHPATMIIEDSSHRFMTDAEKAIVNAPKPSWITPTMQNGWESRGGLAFTKLQNGAVVFKGGFISGTNGLAAFTLPVAYRPGQNRFFIVGDASPNGTLHILTIESSGIVRVNRTTGTGTLAYIDGIAFYDDAGV